MNRINPYDTLSEALARVGITTSNAANYHSKFGITLRVPTMKSLPDNLVTDAVQTAATASTSLALDSRLQALIDDVKPKLGFAEGGNIMLIADELALPVSSSPTVMVVQANTAQPVSNESRHVLGVAISLNGIPFRLWCSPTTAMRMAIRSPLL